VILANLPCEHIGVKLPFPDLFQQLLLMDDIYWDARLEVGLDHARKDLTIQAAKFSASRTLIGTGTGTGTGSSKDNKDDDIEYERSPNRRWLLASRVVIYQDHGRRRHVLRSLISLSATSLPNLLGTSSSSSSSSMDVMDVIPKHWTLQSDPWGRPKVGWLVSNGVGATLSVDDKHCSLPSRDKSPLWMDCLTISLPNFIPPILQIVFHYLDD
jgi:hypothetical protein